MLTPLYHYVIDTNNVCLEYNSRRHWNVCRTIVLTLAKQWSVLCRYFDVYVHKATHQAMQN